MNKALAPCRRIQQFINIINVLPGPQLKQFQFSLLTNFTAFYRTEFQGVRSSRVRFPAGAWKFSLHHRVQNGYVTHPASYPMGTRAVSLGVRRPGRGSDHSPLSSAEVKEWMELYFHSPNTPSRRCARLKRRDNFTFTINTIILHMHYLCISYFYYGSRHFSP